MARSNKDIVNFLFEVGILAKSSRTGFHFMGGGPQSIAEHINRTVYIGYALAKLEKNVDVSKVTLMCQFHDLAESRTGDLNYVHQKYVISNELEAMDEILVHLPFADDV